MLGGVTARRSRRGGGAIPAALSTALILAACGSAGTHTRTDPKTTTATTSSTTAAEPIVAVLHTPGHRARVGDWPITNTLTRGGRPIHGHVSYEFLYGGQVVSTQPVRYRPADFVGVFHDVIQWPARAVGIPLTFRAVVTTAYGVKDLDYAVQVT